MNLETTWATNRTPSHGFVLHGTETGARFNLIEPDVTLHGGNTNLPTTIPCVNATMASWPSNGRFSVV